MKRVRRSKGPYKGSMKPAVVEAFKKYGTFEATAEATGIASNTILEWRNTDPEFCAQIDGARLSMVRALENKALDLAMGGSEKMIEFLLKAENRRKYGDRYDVAIINGTLERVAEILQRLVPERMADIMQEIEGAADRA